MKSLGFVIAFFISTFANAQSQCLDLFKTQNQPRLSANLERELEAEFLNSNIYERLEMLDYVTVELQNKLQQTPRPGVLSWFTFDGARQRRSHSELKALSLEVKELRDAYRVVNSLLHGSVKNHNLKREDEVQLLNRLINEKEMLGALRFLQQRQSDMAGRDRLEQHFIDAVILYLAWGPNPKKFPVPIKSWLIFDIFLGHEDPKYMIHVASLFHDMALVYKGAKRGLSEQEAHIEEYSVLMQDRVFAFIEKTEKMSPNVVERLIDQELDRGHIILDDSGELHIVDDSL